MNMPASLSTKIESSAEPLVFYEVIPPSAGVPGDLEDRLALVRDVAAHVDAINVPEIREEIRQGTRRKHIPQRIEPRAFAQAIAKATHADTVINRITVHESREEQRQWLRESYENYGIRNLILVGGDTHELKYPGPSVLEAAEMAAEQRIPFLLGGIAIPSRNEEERRVLRKLEAGLRFFTTQVLLDSSEIIRLIHSLDGRRVRIVLSFTPISHPRDLKFLEWLGVESPAAVKEQIEQAGGQEQAVETSLELARRILAEVFDRLPPQPPALGLQVERITKRNSAAARRMLAELSAEYRRLLAARYPSAPVGAETENQSGKALQPQRKGSADTGPSIPPPSPRGARPS
jgi:5,10-methylenetetrahydrofolate reductase